MKYIDWGSIALCVLLVCLTASCIAEMHFDHQRYVLEHHSK